MTGRGKSVVRVAESAAITDVATVLGRIQENPRLSRVLEIWRSARADPPNIPRKPDVDPVDLAKAGVMPYLWIVEKVGPDRYRYRLAGEEINRNFDGGLKGRFVEEIFDANTADYVAARLRRIIDGSQLEYTCGDVFRDGEKAYYAHRLMLPLADDRGTPTFALGVAEQMSYHGLADYENPPTYHYEFIGKVPADRV